MIFKYLCTSDQVLNRIPIISDFKLDSNLKDAIRQAQSSFNSRIKSLGLAHLQYNTFTKKFLKEKKFSPDSVMQLAIQVSISVIQMNFHSVYDFLALYQERITCSNMLHA